MAQQGSCLDEVGVHELAAEHNVGIGHGGVVVGVAGERGQLGHPRLDGAAAQGRNSRVKAARAVGRVQPGEEGLLVEL